MLSAAAESRIQQKYKQLKFYFDEASLRAWAASEALNLGHGGITSVSRATGLSRTTIHAGITELGQPRPSASLTSRRASIRQSGGGRKTLVEKDVSLLSDLENLVEPAPEAIQNHLYVGQVKVVRNLLKPFKLRGIRLAQERFVRFWTT